VFYWKDRYRRFGCDFRAVGSGDPRGELVRYAHQNRKFIEFVRDCSIELTGTTCIELGSGNGFWGRCYLTPG
jgi:hypothetical protein